MPAPTWIGQTIGGRYQIESLLGQGGMSTVYRATDPNLHRPVAIKLIHSHLAADPTFVIRFEEEATAVARLRHPNIIQVFDFNHDGDTYYIVLEYVPGETLQARLKTLSAQGARLSQPTAVNLMATICDAVHYAHEQGMIHRDLKPANVMINQQNQPILMDFGVAKMLGGKQHTATGAVIGTPQYISPEQVKGERPDARSDIYSLGIMLFEMLTGRCPFDADSAITLMMMHINEPVPDIRGLVDEVPAELSAIVECALAKKPEGRYQTAAEMAETLRSVYSKLGAPATGVFTAGPVTSSVAVTSEATPTRATLAPAVKPDTRVKSAAGGFPFVPVLVGAGVLLLVGLIVGGLFLVSRSFGGSTTAGNLPDATGMIHINKGAYTVGVETPDANHESLQQAKLEEFWIDQYEITNEQYAKYVKEKNPPVPEGWANGAFPTGQEKQPVQGVTWDQATAYCEWASKRLPTEAEWEVAARGPQSTLYPWGDDAGAVQLPRAGTYNVGSVSGNRSRFGLYDMAGNAWEWVSTPYGPVPGGQKVLRGGSNDFLKDMAYRLVGDPNEKTMQASSGFRCAAPKAAGAAATGPAVTLAPTQLAPGVLYQDDFADPKSGWPVIVENGNTTGYHPQSFYHLEVGKANNTLVALRGNQNLGNVVVETDALVDHLSNPPLPNANFRYGLALRASKENYYAFMISSQTKTWTIAKHSASGFEKLAEGNEESIRAGTGLNNLRATLNGSTLKFEINGNVVGQVTDTAYASGDIGFVVETFDEPLAHIHFDTVTVREIEGVPVLPQATEQPTAPPATGEPTLAPTATQPVPTSTQPEPTPTATEAVVVPPVPAGVVLIPAGFFQMGSSTGLANEKPEHPVLLDAFYLDKTEVTNAGYRQCVEAGACQRSGSPNAADDLPVVLVKWDQAQTYCNWVGKRLPTEAEWEFAASGPENFKWPWGNEFKLNLSAASAGSLRPVGSYPDGASPFGALDMAGNANEWVADAFDAKFYANSPTTHPFDEAQNNNRIFRGGGYDNPDGSYFTTSRRYVKTTLFSDVDVGFRCAQDAPEVNAAESRADHANRVTEFCTVYVAYKPEAQGKCP